jgi:hypothetical protein
MGTRDIRKAAADVAWRTIAWGAIVAGLCWLLVRVWTDSMLERKRSAWRQMLGRLRDVPKRLRRRDRTA